MRYGPCSASPAMKLSGDGNAVRWRTAEQDDASAEDADALMPRLRGASCDEDEEETEMA